MKTTIRLLLAVLSFPFMLLADDGGLSIQKALQVTENQTLLTQRLTKTYLALCYDHDNARLLNDRAEVEALFEDQLTDLASIISSPQVEARLHEVETAWSAYQAEADVPLEKVAIPRLVKASEALLTACKGLHAAYEADSYRAKKSNEMITIDQYVKQNQNQLVLLESLMSYYLANKQSKDEVNFSVELKRTQKSFERVLLILEHANITSPAIQKHLVRIRSTWANMQEELLMYHGDLNEIPFMLTKGKQLATLIGQIKAGYRLLGDRLVINYALKEVTTQMITAEQMSVAYLKRETETEGALDASIKKFEAHLKAVAFTVPRKEVQEAINQVKTLWKDYKTLVQGVSYDPAHISTVVGANENLMAACTQLKEAIVYDEELSAFDLEGSNAAAEKAMHPVKLTGQMSVAFASLERIALTYEATQDEATFNASVGAVRQLVQENLQLLQSTTVNTPKIASELRYCAGQWRVWNAMLRSNNKKLVQDTQKQLAILSEKLDQVNDLYEHRLNALFAKTLNLKNLNY